MALRQVLTTKTVYVGGGGEGSTSTIDSIGLYARVLLSDTITNVATDNLTLYARVGLDDASPGQSDDISLYAKVNLADSAGGQVDALNKVALTTVDTAAAQSDDYRLGLGIADTNAAPGDTLNIGTLIADTAPPQADALNRLALGMTETNNTPDDALTALALAGILDTNATPTEAIKTGFKGGGLSDTSPGQGDGFSTVVTTWATSSSTSGAATTNAANGVGQANGTLAIVKGSGGALGGTSATYTLTIPVASIPASGTKTLLIYATHVTGLLVTDTLTYTNTGGNPASGSVTFNDNNAIGTPYTVPLTTIGTALSVTFTANTAALGAVGEFDVDAVGVRTVAPF